MIEKWDGDKQRQFPERGTHMDLIQMKRPQLHDPKTGEMTVQRHLHLQAGDGPEVW